MELTGLLPFVRDLPRYRQLRASLDRPGVEARAIVLEEAKPALVACLTQDVGAPVLLVTARGGRASMLTEQLRSWLGPSAPVLLLAEPDVLPYERLSPDTDVVRERLQVLYTLLSLKEEGSRPVIVTSITALTTPTIAPEAFAAAMVTLAQGGRFRWDRMASQWLRMGYELTSTVEQPGQFARRGGIVDCYPPQMEEPFRLELFGDEIENIRLFDPASQRSTRLVHAVTIPPARELLGPPWTAPPPELRLETCAPAVQAAYREDLRGLVEGQEVKTPWFYAPLFSRASVVDYLPPDALTVLDEPQELQWTFDEYQRQAQKLRDDLLSKSELPTDFPEPYHDFAWVLSRVKSGSRSLHLHRWGGEGEEDVGFAPTSGYAGRLPAVIADLRQAMRAGERVVLVSHQSQRLADLLDEQGIIAQPTENLDSPPAPKTVTLVHGSLPGGWLLPLSAASSGQPVTEAALPAERAKTGRLRRPAERPTVGIPPVGPPDRLADQEQLFVSQRTQSGVACAITLLTDAEIFGFVKENRRRLSRRTATRENPLLGLNPGDCVVHVEHGIGRFMGTVTMEEHPGVEKEYFFLEYAEGARLYVPTEQVDRVARYIGPGGHMPALSRLGTQEWERAKERVRKAAADSARELLETTAARQVIPGVAFSGDTVWQQELEASFPYLETPDQLRAVQDVKKDLEYPRPMDRLVCGDVGYGKTEVAVRAAFKTVQEGMQVAVLVPTTVLAQQHFQTFSQRLGAFPVAMEVLSRFRSGREQEVVLQRLIAGTVDIVIGTHRLLQKDVAFKNLGLVVVDEEQRFGVLHKEYFKRMRREVDVLTLSATPIPRTLYMALVGVRDMSMMETPPEERLPIKTYVMEYDEGIVRQAVVRELERGGQVFLVHNRVQTISYIARQLRQLVPEATIGVAHGQMPEETLEQVMLDFSAGKYDVLVCTTIIESGLDLPNVNTIIINDADKLGLGQLYQLRGRVGRGTNRAYAYLLFTRNKALTEKAEKRLQAVFEATDLGAGYYIAMKDLEIRGAGNLLGVEQSGQIGAVGFDLYCRILRAAVEDAKAVAEDRPAPSQIPQPPPVTVDLRLPAHLPEDYVADMDVRLGLYRRLAAAPDLGAVEEIAQELHDRFGPSPVAVANLLFGVRVKLLATEAGVASVAQEEAHIVLRLLEGLRVDRGPLADLQGARPGQNQVRLEIAGRPDRWQPLVEETLSRMRR